MQETYIYQNIQVEKNTFLLMIGHYEDSLLANFTNADPAFANAQLRFKVKTKGTKVVNIRDFKG